MMRAMVVAAMVLLLGLATPSARGEPIVDVYILNYDDLGSVRRFLLRIGAEVRAPTDGDAGTVCRSGGTPAAFFRWPAWKPGEWKSICLGGDTASTDDAALFCSLLTPLGWRLLAHDQEIRRVICVAPEPEPAKPSPAPMPPTPTALRQAGTPPAPGFWPAITWLLGDLL
ncbi:MAG: hypothetical protein HY323_07230 [Betaproteobacteria bacterium]|nr:hypothetical protein [Betaproteobacteria bacterium]